SVITLHLTINNSVEGSDTVTVCDSYYWSSKDSTYVISATDTAILTSSGGCDSIVTLYLTVNRSDTTTIDTTVCESYYWSLKDSTYTASGTDTVLYQNINGCDSIITL